MRQAQVKVMLGRLHTFFVSLCAVGVCFFAACSDEEKKLEEARVRDMRTREILSNTCHEDQDCMMTGCRKMLCSSMDQADACDHRLVIALEYPEDIKAVENFVKQRLTVREAESVRVGGYAAGLWTVSFQASLSQRHSIQFALETIAMSGLAVLHKNVVEDSQALFEAFKGDPDVSLRHMHGAGRLVEKQIRSGDWLSKDDIRDTWLGITPVLENTFDIKNDIEHLWAYDIITGNIAFIRLWPIDSRTRIPLSQWKDFKYRLENGDIHMEGSLNDHAASVFESWTEARKLILLTLGNEVLASALPKQTIDDGSFDMIIRAGSDHHDLMAALDSFREISLMKGTVRIDAEATARVERDIACHQKAERECGCIDGTCGWKQNPAYNACLYE